VTKLDSIPFSTSAALLAEVEEFLKKVNEDFAIGAVSGPMAVKVELGCRDQPFSIRCGSLPEAMAKLRENLVQIVSIAIGPCTLGDEVAVKVILSQKKIDLQISGLHRPAALQAAVKLSDFLLKLSAPV